MDDEPKLKKEIDLDEIHMKWEDDIFPEEKMLGTLIFSDKKIKDKR